MKSFISTARRALSVSEYRRPSQIGIPSVEDAIAVLPPVSFADVTRYRYHHGTNLGSVFILERWLTPAMFHVKAAGASELAAVEAWVKHEGLEGARDRLEQHWKDYISDDDLDWLRDVAKCTTVRLPIGYFTLGPTFCKNTPFKAVSEVYENAWYYVKEMIGRCHMRGIGVVIDMHGLPGGANAQEHSGTNSGKAEFWSTRKHRDLAIRAICFVVQQIYNMEGVAGVQLVNEAEWKAEDMYDWYEKVLFEVARVDPTQMPLYISDAWDLTRAAQWAQQHNHLKSPLELNPVVVDTHLYWCFNEGDLKKPARQITDEVCEKLTEHEMNDGNVTDHGAAQVVVGEYSCVLGDDSWQKSHGISKEDLVRGFGKAQSQRYQQRTGGSFFWTYRMDWMPGGEWGFKHMTEQCAVIPPVSLTLKSSEVERRTNTAHLQCDERREYAVLAHRHYWETHHPGHYEHSRFEQGWKVGFKDAMGFFGMRSQFGLQGADKIGMLDLWCFKRLRESGQEGPFVWQFEQGMRQGIKDFYACARV